MNKRILWFTHNDCGYSRKFFSNKSIPHTGTWTESIARLVSENSNINLGIAFLSKWYHETKSENNVTYYPVSSNISQSKLTRFIFKLKNQKVDYEDKIDAYLDIVDKFEPDLIHVFGTEENFGFLSKYVKVPVVVSIQGNLNVYEWKYFSGLNRQQLFHYFDFNELIRLNTSFHKYSVFKFKAQREKELLTHVKYIIGRTDWDRRITRVLSPNSEYFHNDEVLRDVFYNYSPSFAPLGENFKIMTISGPAPYKGLETVCYAIYLLNNLGVKFSWSIVGLKEDDKLVNSIRKKLGESFPSRNIHFLGKMEGENILEELKQSNLYVLPSHIENSPLTLSEAMICGIPIITSSSGGIPSRISSEDGIIIQSGDPWVLTGAILEVLNNYDLAVVRAKSARKRALLRHNREKIKSELFFIYKELLIR